MRVDVKSKFEDAITDCSRGFNGKVGELDELQV